MVQYAHLAIAATALVPFVTASNCKDNLDYCGWDLLKIGEQQKKLTDGTVPVAQTNARAGNYQGQINAALGDVGEKTSDDVVKNSLFHCDGGSNGDIRFVSHCSPCVDGGTGHSDTCQGPDTGNCVSGLNYCSTTLELRGKYDTRVSDALRSVGQEPNSLNKLGSLFHCNSDGNTISFLQHCDSNKCHDGGPGNSDICVSAPGSNGACIPALSYCGDTLLGKNKDFFQSRITNELSKNQQPTDDATARSSLFLCLASGQDIEWITDCRPSPSGGYCADGGSKKPDFCKDN